MRKLHLLKVNVNLRLSRAEGHKRASILKAEGEREAAVLEAQGQKEAQELKAQGYSKALAVISETASNLDERTMALQYMEMLEKVGSSASTKFVVPMELVGFVNQFTKVTGINGASKERPRISGD